jgi:chromosomal replication initiation ATPase DnaA
MMNKFSLAREQILLKRRGNIYRPLAMHLIKENTGLSLREIGALFNMDYAAVSQACRRFEEKVRTDKSVREISEALEGVLQELNVKC